jgi:AraC family transcriptional regulator, transcriptional activator FtrA
VSLCTGAFVLAAAGLLDGRCATTHWTECTRLAESYPSVSVDPNVLYVDEGDILTSAGSAASIDLCLHVVRADYGAEIANRLARQLVVAPHRAGGQAQYIEAPVPQGESLDLFGDTMAWMREHLCEPMSVAELADRSAMSRRTFARRFAASTGTTPYQWLLNQRIPAGTRAARGQRHAGGACGGKQRLRNGCEPAQALRAHAAHSAAGLSRDVQQRSGFPNLTQVAKRLTLE